MGGAASSAAASSPPLKFDSMQQGSDDIKRDLSAEVRRRVEQKAEDNAALRNLYLPEPVPIAVLEAFPYKKKILESVRLMAPHAASITTRALLIKWETHYPGGGKNITRIDVQCKLTSGKSVRLWCSEPGMSKRYVFECSTNDFTSLPQNAVSVNSIGVLVGGFPHLSDDNIPCLICRARARCRPGYGNWSKLSSLLRPLNALMQTPRTGEETSSTVVLKWSALTHGKVLYHKIIVLDRV